MFTCVRIGGKETFSVDSVGSAGSATNVRPSRGTGPTLSTSRRVVRSNFGTLLRSCLGSGRQHGIRHVAGTFGFTGRTRTNIGHHSNRPCVVRPVTITHVIYHRVKLNSASVYSTLLRSIIRSARCAIRSVGSVFNRGVTRVISNLAGVSNNVFNRRTSTRTRGFHGLLLAVDSSVQIVLVGVTSHLRGVHALNSVLPTGRFGVTNRALCLCTPLTRHLKLFAVGARLRSLDFGCRRPRRCTFVGLGLGSARTTHGALFRRFTIPISEGLGRVKLGCRVHTHIGSTCSV